MAKIHENDKKIIVEIEREAFSGPQLRALKTLLTTLPQILKTHDEAEFFDGSAEAMRVLASIIKQASFIQNLKDFDDIPYDKQVIEYSIDILQDYMNASKVIQYDN